MGKVTIRWRDLDNRYPGEERVRELTLEGKNVGYDVGSDPGNVFVKVWADDKTFLVYDNRVILVDVEK